MRARTLLTITAIVSSMLGAVVAYLVLTIPNDLRAGAVLRDAQKQMSAGENDAARRSLIHVVQQYPRTDAAASAIVGLSMLSDRERQQMAARIEMLERARAETQRQVAAVNEQLRSQAGATATAPAVVPVTPVVAPVVGPPVPPAPAKKAPQRKVSRSRHRKKHH